MTKSKKLNTEAIFLKDLMPTKVNHGKGTKFVFLPNESLNNNLTQIAYGTFLPGQSCDFHIHQTMDEYFFFIKGSGVYIIEDKKIEIQSGLFLEITSGKKHRLLANGKDNLVFVYWGISV